MFELLLEPDPKLVPSLMNENTECTLHYPVRSLHVNKPSASIKKALLGIYSSLVPVSICLPLVKRFASKTPLTLALLTVPLSND